MVNIILMFAIGIISGVISGLGIGGGTVLIPALTIIYGFEQHTAQNINLIYYVPTAAIALISHAKQRNIETEVVKPLVIFGVIGAIAGSLLAINIDNFWLKKLFGFFLLSMGIVEIRRKHSDGDRK